MMSGDGKKRVLRFDGALTLPEAESVRASLLSSLLGDTNAVEIDCGQASEVDISFIQLVLAGRRMAAACGKSLRLSAPARGALRAALERGGFMGDASGRGGADGFWQGEEAAR